MPTPPLRRAFVLALAAAAAAAAAQDTPAPPPPPPPEPVPAAPTAAPARVEVTGGRVSDTEERRESTAAKIVIGRDEIERYGDSTLGEVLRRLPGVTTPGAPGRGGPPRLRGLGGGYTQLLIDGQRVPPGFSLEQLTPEQVERIEILRAPTAETGARAIAGTINIVTREGLRRRLNDLRAGTGVENGAVSSNLSWTHNDTTGPLTHTVSGSAFRARRESVSTTVTTTEELATGAVTRRQSETTEASERRSGLNLSSRLQWRLGDGGETLMLSPNFFHAEGRPSRRFALGQDLGDEPPPYDLGTVAHRSRYTALRLNGLWRRPLAGGRVELNGGAGGWRSHGRNLRSEFETGADAPLRTIDDSTRSRERSLNLTAKFSRLLDGSGAPGREHSLVAGAEVAAVQRSESRLTLDNGVPQLAEFGDDLEARSLRLAAFVQDEWNPSPQWSFNVGLRWEGITTRGAAADGPAPENRSRVLTPLAHAVWKPDPQRRDQWRLALTRSYRAPGLGDLIARPRLSSRYPADVPNDRTNPDRAGNPALRPERALGLDLGFERYLEGGGVLSANLFHRRIADLLRTVTAPETVPGRGFQRWVARTQNVGDAVTSGIELDAKARLDQLLGADAPRVDLRGNLAFYRSRVDGVPGPDNRLAEQAKASANLGADWRVRGWPLTVGGHLNWVPGYRTQLTADQASTVSTKRVFDLYALWTLAPGTALRATASNLTAADFESSNALDAAGVRETARSFGPSYVNWQLRLELKL